MTLNVDGEPRLTTSRPTDPAEETGRQPLVILAASEQRAMLLQQLFTQAATAYNPARLRYQQGADALLPLLDSQRSRLSAEDSLVQAQLSATWRRACSRHFGGGF